MAIEKDTLDQLLVGRDPKEIFSKDGLFDELKKALAERILNAELEDHLGGEPADGKPNHRNGYSKSVLTESSTYGCRATERGRSIPYSPCRSSAWRWSAPSPGNRVA